MNAMEEARLEKVTLNIGVGSAGEKLDNARDLLERLSGSKAVYTKAKTRQSTFKVKKGENIGVKVTLRGKKAEEVVSRCLEALDKRVKDTNFDKYGNFAFGVKEYIDVPGLKYDPKIGMMGFDVCLTLGKPGRRVARRRIAKSRVSPKNYVTTQEAQAFVKKKFGAMIETAGAEE